MMNPVVVRTGALSWRPGRLLGSSELVTEVTREFTGTCGVVLVRKKGSAWCDWSEKKEVRSLTSYV